MQILSDLSAKVLYCVWLMSCHAEALLGQQRWEVWQQYGWDRDPGIMSSPQLLSGRLRILYIAGKGSWQLLAAFPVVLHCDTSRLEAQAVPNASRE